MLALERGSTELALGCLDAPMRQFNPNQLQTFLRTLQLDSREPAGSATQLAELWGGCGKARGRPLVAL